MEMVLDRHMLVILMGGAAAVGVVSKILAGASLRRLERAAGNMGKSSHPLIRLVKARFEHACMVSDRVQNVEVFVEKYLHEYRTAGLKLHTWRRLERAGVWLCLLFGLAGAGAWYGVYGMSDGVLQYAAGGAGAAVLVFLFQLTGDERYQLTVIRNYMVDHLENVCAHRYEKMQAGKVKEEWKAMAPPQEAKAEPARRGGPCQVCLLRRLRQGRFPWRRPQPGADRRAGQSRPPGQPSGRNPPCRWKRLSGETCVKSRGEICGKICRRRARRRTYL